MILLIDNYDSFTYNLAHLVGSEGHIVEVVRNDAFDVATVATGDADAVLLSPGPGVPASAGLCLDLIRACVASEKPVFGVCLGMQAIAEALGGSVVRANNLMHGKTCEVTTSGGRLFRDVPSPFTATRYHSLIVDPSSIEDLPLEVTAKSCGDGEVMAIEHQTLALAGVQFHPESIASDEGARIFNNFMAWASEQRDMSQPKKTA
ncbi:MAG: aminodeoxychorismate/anthranilate synthase component II [Pseudomonadota bacterium]